MPGMRQSNFSQLKAHDEQLERLGLLAERYFADDPNTCLLKLRQLAEGMAQSVADDTTIDALQLSPRGDSPITREFCTTG